MGNAHSSDHSISCISGVESTKGDTITMVSSDSMEVLEYLKSQQDLESLAVSAEENAASSPSGAAANQTNFTDDSITASEQSSLRRRLSKKPSLKGLRNKGHRIFDNVGRAFQAAGQAVGEKLHNVEDFMFPHTPQFRNSVRQGHPIQAITPKVRGGVLLRGCHTDDEHRQMTRETVERLRQLKGEEGLKAVGLEYRLVPVDYSNNDDVGETAENDETEVPGLVTESMCSEGESAREELSAHEEIPDPTKMYTRLFHAESNIMITNENRKEFIADGDMYDVVARICQEHAQEVMIREGNLEWVLVCEAGNNPEPIRALVSKSLSQDESNLDKMPTLLIATGKGKVRAGVFSRQHLILSGMECSTAVPIIREAQKRNMNVVMLDPNVHGDRLGMITFEKSMARLFRRWEEDETCSSAEPPLANRDLFVLSHSQSGAQLARYLLEKSQSYLPHIRAVAFTDSTHNIQWARANKDLHRLLESDNCIYFRGSKESSNALAPLETLGQEIDTDSFWQHRFGRIRTLCAGTTEHSLTNWFARYHIWDHFDTFLHNKSSTHSCQEEVDFRLED